MEIINHQFYKKKFFFPNWKISVLVLGTFNPECGEKTDYYYGRCRNNFWRTIESIKEFEYMALQNNFSKKKKLMETNKFGCVDIIKSAKLISKNSRNDICGAGYSDQVIFSQKKVVLNYQFDYIIKFIMAKGVSKIINTWGKRNKPKRFREEIIKLENYCTQNKIEFIKDCPSPSGRLRGKGNKKKLTDFYRTHIFGM